MTTKKVGSLDTHPAVAAALAKVATISARASDLQRQIDAAHAARDGASGLSARRLAKAEALVSGALDQVPPEVPTLDDIAALREELLTLREARRLADQKLDAARQTASMEMLAEVAPELDALALDAARKLVAAGEASEKLQARLAELDDAGVRVYLSYPHLAFGPFRASAGDSQLNLLVDSLEAGFGVEVKRPTLDAAARAAERRHLVEQEERRATQRCVAAGPNGLTVYTPGKKPVTHRPVTDGNWGWREGGAA